MQERRKQIADWVKKARRGRGMTQAQLAEKVGVHEQTVGNLERATVEVSPDVLGRVEKELGISLSEKRLANQAAADVIMARVERKLDDLDEAEGLILTGELLSFVATWDPNGNGNPDDGDRDKPPRPRHGGGTAALVGLGLLSSLAYLTDTAPSVLL